MVSSAALAITARAESIIRTADPHRTHRDVLLAKIDSWIAAHNNVLPRPDGREEHEAYGAELREARAHVERTTRPDEANVAKLIALAERETCLQQGSRRDRVLTRLGAQRAGLFDDRWIAPYGERHEYNSRIDELNAAISLVESTFHD